MSKELAIRLGHQDIIFENEDYIAVNKKRGWPVHQTLDPKRANLFTALKAFLKNRSNGEECYLALHHRLDVQTSGIVLFAKTVRANPILAKIFEQRTAEKKYLALCLGAPKEEEGEWADFLQKKTIDRHEKMVKVMKGGQKAITKYHLRERIAEGKFAEIELDLVTGRMHQIRVQSALAGHPLVGDDLYGDKDFNQRFSLHAQMLHAYQLTFFDPLSSKAITIEAPIPADYVEAKKALVNNIETRSAKSSSYRYILFHKPYDVLCQFTSPNADELTLANFNLPQDVYPVGRLDKDSEGLLLLTDDGKTKDRLANPRFEKEKTYWVQIEGLPSEADLDKMRKGLKTSKDRFLPCKAKILSEDLTESIPPRVPPIRERKNIPTTWIEVIITEGKNRQVRKMTAAIGYPTLRLIRVAMDGQKLGELRPGEFSEILKF